MASATSTIATVSTILPATSMIAPATSTGTRSGVAADVSREQVAGCAVEVAAAAVVSPGRAGGGVAHGVLQVAQAGAGIQTGSGWQRHAASRAATGSRPGRRGARQRGRAGAAGRGPRPGTSGPQCLWRTAPAAAPRPPCRPGVVCPAGQERRREGRDGRALAMPAVLQLGVTGDMSYPPPRAGRFGHALSAAFTLPRAWSRLRRPTPGRRQVTSTVAARCDHGQRAEIGRRRDRGLLREAPALVGASPARVDDELRAVLGGVARVVKA